MLKHETADRTEEQRTGLSPGDLIPFFEGETIDGRRLRYEEVWQRRNVILFVLSATARAEASVYLSGVQARVSELRPDDTTLVVCDRKINGVPLDGVVVADRWGEIAYIRELTSHPGEWPSVNEILEWVEFIRVKCPECPP
jgi:hypothetical protein